MENKTIYLPPLWPDVLNREYCNIRGHDEKSIEMDLSRRVRSQPLTGRFAAVQLGVHADRKHQTAQRTPAVHDWIRFGYSLTGLLLKDSRCFLFHATMSVPHHSQQGGR